MPASRRAITDDQKAIQGLRRWSEPLPSPGEPAFADPFDVFGSARVVLLGESTHGTAEFYRARAAITRRLIERHGFTIVAVEADWPDTAQIDGYVRQRPVAPLPEPLFARFPSWMWRNAEMRDFIGWLRAHNGALSHERRAEFRGLDIYSLGASIAAVLHVLDAQDPDAAKAARERYGCLSPWQSDPARYGAAVLSGKQPCEDEAVEQLRQLVDARMDAQAGAGFDAVQNARVVRSAEHYYRAMYASSDASWNLRDRHMFDTLQTLLAARPGAKAVVWAHNSHIGNAAATGMGWRGQFNVGELCRTAFGEDAALIGFGTDRGTVAAASDWDGPMELKPVRPARADSREALFRDAGLRRSLTRLRTPDLRETLAEPRRERAIGVIYRPETELQSHYFEAVLPDQFDAYVWFEETTAVTPLPGPHARGEPETFPFGT